ncbi:tripartite tricarboxylate transporter TctB family protein [Stutzerimonas sp. VN223-3]|uniref:tripartite tricarboxylate transporter TctB family protein n=1 Tax=Stutzerimonas sp. VN223-3 TaxID=3384601 RepID=UPI0038B69B38
MNHHASLGRATSQPLQPDHLTGPLRSLSPAQSNPSRYPSGSNSAGASRLSTQEQDMKEPKIRLVGELVFGVGLLVLSLVIGCLAYGISGFSSINSAGAFPLGISFIMVASALWCLVEALAKKPAAVHGLAALRQFCREHFPIRIVVFVALTIAYLIAMDWVSFYVSTFVFTSACIFYLRRGGLLLSIGVSAAMLAIIYLMFTLVFSVYLP